MSILNDVSGAARALFGSPEKATPAKPAARRAAATVTPPVAAARKPRSPLVIGGARYEGKPFSIGGEFAIIDGKKVPVPVKRNPEAYVMPVEHECMHTLIVGATGVGKSNAFKQIFDQVRERPDDKAIFIDNGYEMTRRYARPGDIIFNPLDTRWPGWGPYNEISESEHCDMFGPVVVPEGTGDSKQWHEYGQNLASAIFEKGLKTGETTTEQFLLHASQSSNEALKEYVFPDPTHVQLSEDRTAISIRGIISNFLRSWRYFEPRPGSFSFREWVLNDNDKRWIFVPYMDDQIRSIMPIISMAAASVITFALSLPESRQRRIWASFDEFATLEVLPNFSGALEKGRKRGLCTVTGIQSISQVNSKFGKEQADTILSNFRNWIIFNPGYVASAKLLSEQIGDIELDEESENTGTNMGGSSNGMGMSAGSSRSLRTKPLVMPSELMGMPNGFCLIRPAESNCVRRTFVPYTPKPDIAAGFTRWRAPKVAPPTETESVL